MLLHDRRLRGTPPSIAQNTYQVDANTPTIGMVRWVGTYAQRQNGLDELIVMCHGYHTGVTFDGLQLSENDITLANMVLTAEWNPHIAKIILFACGAANPGIKGPARSGQVFCRTLAQITGATVFASDENQRYRGWNVLREFLDWEGTISFGAWEGQVYRFLPNGTVSPYEFPDHPATR